MSKIDKLIEIARRAPDSRSTEAPPFFAQRVAAQWRARAEEAGTSMWEALALRGLVVSVSVMTIAVALNSAFSPANFGSEEIDYTSAIFSIP